MITLIGHGYVAKYISGELISQGIKFNWTHHTDGIPWDTKFIINAAGFTGVPNVDACEFDRDKTIQGNVLFPLELERNAKQREIPVLHITSGCVYTGYVDGGWLEEDAPNFTFDNASFYSASKALFQELWSEQFANRSYLFRIRMPFGPDKDPKNLLTKLTKYDKLIDNINSLSNVQEVAKAAVHFALYRPKPGIYNAVNPNGVSTEQIATLLELDKQWLTPDEFDSITVAPRSNCVLNTDKMQEVYKFKDSYQSLYQTIANIV